MLASASRRTSYGVVSFLLLLFFTALVIQYRDTSRSSLESMLHTAQPTGAETKTPEKPTESPSSTPQAGPGARPHVTSLGRISRLHYLVPTTLVKPPVCAVVASALVNRFPIPVLVGYKATGEFDAKAAHIAKLRAITRYLHGPTAGEDDDLVIVVDGFDVLAQIPAETLIQRYFDVAAAADQRLADQRGLTVEEVHSKGLRQTVLWGTDKGCFPSSGNGDEKQRDPRCWLVPFSTLPRYVWGPETGTGGLPFSDSRFVNSGTVIGPLGDLRTLIDATLALIEDTFDPEYKYHNSDQYYVSTLYARQEYQRALDLNDGVFPGGRDDYTFPEPRRDGHDVTDATTKSSCAASASLRRLFDALLDDERPVDSARAWIAGLRLGTNTATRHIYAFYHNTCSKKAFVDKYYDSWFFPVLRPLLRAAVRAIQADEPIHPRPIDGRIWVVAHRYPENVELEDEFGGVFTDAADEPFIPLQKLCSGEAAPVIGTKKPVKKPEKQAAKLEAKPDVKPELKPEMKPQDKAETKPEEKPQVTPEQKPETKQEDKPVDKPEEKPEGKPEDTSAGKPDDKQEKPKENPGEQPKEMPEGKPEERPAEKPEDKPQEKPEDKPKDGHHDLDDSKAVNPQAQPCVLILPPLPSVSHAAQTSQSWLSIPHSHWQACVSPDAPNSPSHAQVKCSRVPARPTVAAGGTFGFVRTRSKPSLIAGLTLGTSFAFAGYLLKKNKDYGAELALGSSVVLLGAGAQRLIATQAKSRPAIGLTVAGALSTFYYQKKFREFRFGV
ncbi:hypothetical protein BN1708_015740 [Verticillium longisporum]|uniref:Uncharacterized protein n=2 Tax=Verticillium TaxID=1036719 RepID=A0A0G4M712_VERLO|nr:hypothetical protein BN1708_015740 [Verticillium longisporum]